MSRTGAPGQRPALPAAGRRRLGAVALLALLAVPAAPSAQGLPTLADTVRRSGIRVDVGAADYPGANAVILLDDSSITVDQQRLQTITRHRLVKVLRGRGENQAYVRFVVPGSTNLALAARTTTPDGEIVPLAGSDFHRQPIRSADPLAESSAEVVTFTFPAVGTGAMLEYRYQVTLENDLSADLHILDGELPVQVARYALGHPTDEGYRVWGEDPRTGKALAAKRTSSLDLHGRTQILNTIEMRDLPAVPSEPLGDLPMASRVRALAVNTGSAASNLEQEPWRRLASALNSMQELRLVQAEKLRMAVTAASGAAVQPRDKAHAVLRTLNGRVRVEPRHTVSEHYRTIPELLASGVAEPAEYAALLASMLREAGLPAYIGLVNSSSAVDLDPRIPWSGFFDRLMVAVLLKDGPLYFDPLSPDIASGLPRAACQGRRMLIARQSQAQRMSDLGFAAAQFVEIPFQPPEANRSDRTVDLRLDAAGGAALGYRQSLSGELAWEVLDRIRDDGIEVSRATAASELLARLPDVDPASLAVSPGSSAIEVTADLTSRTLLVDSPRGRALDLHRLAMPRLLRTLASLRLDGRRSGIDLGYTQRHRTTIRVTLARGSTLAQLPPSITLEGPGLQYAVALRRTAGGFERTSTLAVHQPRLDLASLPRLADFVAGAIEAEQTLIALSAGAPPPPSAGAR